MTGVYVRIISFFILTSCIPLVLKGQAQKKIDSLVTILNSHSSQDTIRVNLLNEIGFEYWIINPHQSEIFGTAALKLAETLQYREGKALAFRVIGVSHWSRGDYFKALSNLFQSQILYKELNNILGEGNSIMNIGLVYADQKDFGKALENFQYAIQLFERINRRDRIGVTFNKIGTVYLEKGELSKAEEYLLKGLAIHKEYNFHFGIMEATNRLGLLAQASQKPETAIQQLEYSLSLARQNNDIEHTVKNLENLAAVYIGQHQYDRAKPLLDEAFPIALQYQYRKWLREIYKDYRDIYIARNNPGKALEFTNHYEAIKDSIFSEEKASQLANLQVEHQTAQQQQALKFREQEILLLQQQTRFNRLLNAFLISGIILLLVFAYLLFRNQRLRFGKKQLEAERNHALAKIELENARLREEELQQAIEFKNKELTAYTMNFIRKNELIDDIREKLDSIKNNLPEHSKIFTPLFSLLQQNPGIDRDWEDFKKTFENVHQQFFSNLLSLYPDLTQSELRLCALICLNLSIKEMASLMGISPESVKTARYRLRKKFNISQEQNLHDFVIGFTKPSKTQV